MRIAVIGGGIAGLTAALRLGANHEVTLFEAGTRLGGHADTELVQDRDCGTLAVDMGFIVFNRPNYPGFCALLEELGVDSRPSDMSFSVRNDRSHIEYGTGNLRELFSDPVSLVRPRFWKMLLGLRRFYREADTLLDAEPGLTVHQWLQTRGYGQSFVEDHILPMVGALWSADRATAGRFPARHLARFMRNHQMLQVTGRPEWRTVTGGSQRYVEALQRALCATVRTQTAVRSVRRGVGQVELRLDGGSERFDEVVLACHSDQALAMLEDPTRAEREVLGAIGYRNNEVILHDDTAVMPRHLGAWSSWNALVPAQGDGLCTVSYWMNRLQALPTRTPWIVSLNQRDQIDPARVRAVRQHMHPVFTGDALRAQQRWQEISGVRRTHFCGAYWGWGFHEDGVQSALRVVDSVATEATRAAA